MVHVPKEMQVVLSSIPSPMPLLYHWRSDNYRRDLDEGAAYHLNQRSKLLHGIDIGDSLWAFTRRKDGAYVLAAELVVSSKTLNHDRFKYGPYRLWGDLGRSRYFSVEGQPDITALGRGLSNSAASDDGLPPTTQSLGVLTRDVSCSKNHKFQKGGFDSARLDLSRITFYVPCFCGP